MVNEVGQPVNHQELSASRARLDGAALPEQPWADGAAPPAGEPAGIATGLVSLAFISAAIRRGARLWGALALIGLIAGAGVYIAFPPSYQASASVLLTIGPFENLNTASADNQAIAQSRAVANLATRMLGLRQDPGILLADYRVMVAAPDVLQITVSAPSSSEAVIRANAVAAAFLRFRAGELEAEQSLAMKSAAQQVSQARQKLDAISSQIARLPARPTSAAQQAIFSELQRAQSQAATTLTLTQQGANGSRTATATTLAMQGSHVLDAAAAIHQSRLKRVGTRPAVGLAIGLALGLGIVVLRALSSDKLHRRDDIASALGAPVQVSVGEIRLSRRFGRKRGLAAADSTGIRRIVAHLRSEVPAAATAPATLAVLPVGEPETAVLSLVSLALACAHDGRNVLLADLLPDAPAARLLAGGEPGVHPVLRDGVQLLVAVPDGNDAVSTGPLRRSQPCAQGSSFTGAVRVASESADLVLTLAALDPSLAADDLPTWANTAVVVVTAGQSSWTQIHAAGQMLRLAGMRQVSAVLVGADQHDESLGLTGVPGPAAPAGPGPQGPSR